ncbi:transposase [Hydrogenophilus thiooxidans]|uniref:transposase n=1 Tax=Hydrogenophilus thiooxidans TaxID=2820326 RepID=UPI001C242C9F|nr:transposase [Hydrogenophilus thiooxidans]
MQISFSEAEFTGKKKVTRRERFLSELEKLVPWAELTAVIAPYYPKSEGRGGRPIGLERMLRMYLVQQCFGLSDEGCEDALYDSQAIRRFVRIDLSHESAPDETGVVHHLVTTPANVHDVTQAHALVHGEESDVYADAGYQGVDRRAETQGLKICWHVALRAGKRSALCDETARLAERRNASIRAKVEHAFHIVKNRFGHRKVRYRGLAKNTAQLFTLFALANLFLVKRRLLARHGQIAS